MLLSYKEFSLLQLFAQYPDKILSAEFLYEKVWGYEISDNNLTLRKALSRLRSKMENSEFVINSVRNEGYTFELKV
jgi:two-component system alkaline phosphatase synthesis response regulator PhoP